MVIYADVLIIFNTAVDYFLIKLTSRLIKEEVKFIRLGLSSLLGGIFSLYIFLPQSNAAAEILIKLIMAMLISLTAFGFKSIKSYIRNIFCLFAVTYLFGGIMLALWAILKPPNMAINNSVVYIGISPIVMIVSSAAYYLFVMLLRFLLERNSKNAEKCTVKLEFNGNTTQINGIVDTGNSLTDVFGNLEIITVSPVVYSKLTESQNAEILKKRYRAVPVKTVSGTSLLNGTRIDLATVKTENGEKTLNSPVIAASKFTLDSEFDAIINPRSLL